MTTQSPYSARYSHYRDTKAVQVTLRGREKKAQLQIPHTNHGKKTYSVFSLRDTVLTCPSVLASSRSYLPTSSVLYLEVCGHLLVLEIKSWIRGLYMRYLYPRYGRAYKPTHGLPCT